MLTLRLPNASAWKKLFARGKRWPLAALGCAVAVLLAAGLVQYQRRVAEAAADEEEARWATRQSTVDERASRASRQDQPRARAKAREVNAAWYDVPDASLAKRRAGSSELTAAHNRLPIGTLVRVTNLNNHKSVTVRITDRGIRDRRVKIDLCKEAAEELAMVRKGIARVRMEIIPEDQGASPENGHTAAPHP